MTPEERTAWLEDRRLSLGASDVPQVLGLSRWGGPWQVWASKVHGIDSDPGIPARVGLALEDLVAELFAERCPDAEVAMPPGLVRPEGDAWAHATPDRWVLWPGQDAPEALQIKTSRSAKGWGPDGSMAIPDTEDGGTVPAAYYVQTMWEMWITLRIHDEQGIPAGAARGWLAVLIGNADFRVYQLEWDPALVRAMVTRCKAWWEAHVIGREAPPIDSTYACGDVLAGLHGQPQGVIALPEGMGTWVDVYLRSMRQRRTYDREARQAKNWILEMLGGARSGLVIMPNGERIEVSRHLRQGRSGPYNTISIRTPPASRRPTVPLLEDEHGIPTYRAMEAR